MNKILFTVASTCMTCMLWADVSVGNVIVRQQWPWSAKVNIDYVLSDPTGGEHDLKLELKNGTTVITPKAGSLSGDLIAVKPGARRIVWDPTVGAGAEDPVALTDFTATVTPEDGGGTFMVIDVSGGASAESYPVSFTSSVPAGGWNQDLYKTDRIVLRRIPAGQTLLGAASDQFGYSANYNVRRKTSFTNAFYVALFETTCKQYVNVMGGSNPNSGYWETSYYTQDTHPVALTSYDQLRGSAAATAHWPGLASDGFLATLNGKLALPAGHEGYGLDLPTVSQWEYACRAGTTGSTHDGTTITNATSDANLSRVAHYGSSGPVLVGTLKPNRFGLYDMQGNVSERCRDWIYHSYPWWDGSDQVEPLLYNNEAALSSSMCTFAAGGRCDYDADWTLCYSFMHASKGNDQEKFCGFRMVFTADRR